MKATRRPGMLPIQHVSISVTDVAEALVFYTETLGFDVLPRPDLGPGAWFGTGNGVQIHLLADPGLRSAGRAPPRLRDRRHRRRGRPTPRRSESQVGDPFQIERMRQAFFVDPSGNQLELNQPLIR